VRSSVGDNERTARLVFQAVRQHLVENRSASGAKWSGPDDLCSCSGRSPRILNAFGRARPVSGKFDVAEDWCGVVVELDLHVSPASGSDAAM